MNNKNFNEINKNINYDSKIMYCYVNDMSTPPFLCSKSFEQWLYADNWKDILGFLYDNVLSLLLVCTLDMVRGLELDENDSKGLFENIMIYKQYKQMTEDQAKAIEFIENSYTNILKQKEFNTKEVIDFFNELKNQLNALELEFDYEVYDNVKLASKSKLISNDEFNENDLKSNFII